MIWGKNGKQKGPHNMPVEYPSQKHARLLPKLDGDRSRAAFSMPISSHAQTSEFSDALLDSIADPVIVFDTSLLVSATNPESVRLFGEISGKHLDAIAKSFVEIDSSQRIHPRDWPPRRSLREGIVVRMRLWWEREAGETLPLDITAAPIRKNGEVQRVIVTMRNISHELALERELHEFVAITSHQLRTPMASIAWFLEILLSGRVGSLSPQQHEIATRARESVIELIDSVRLVLDASQIELGAAAIRPEPQDLTKIINEELGRLRAPAERRKLKLMFTFTDSVVVPVDETAFRLVVANLIGNALKYTPEGGDVTVSLREEAGRILFLVKDTGAGIPKRDQKNVFKKFFRAENVLMTTSGTGLGLYIIKILLERAGGDIWFESEEGKGSVFTVAIPRTGFREVSGRFVLEMPARPLY